MWTAQIPALGENWKEVIERESLVVVFFCAQWSPADYIDHILGAVLRRVAPEFESRLLLRAANLDDAKVLELAAKVEVMTSPQMVVFRLENQQRE